MKIFLFFLSLSFLFASCTNEELLFNTVEIEEDYSSITDPKERWWAYNISDYTIEQSWTCECPPPYSVKSFIKSNKIVKIELEERELEEGYIVPFTEDVYKWAKEQATTVEEAFALVEQYQETAHAVRVQYHPKFGYPTELYIDKAEMIADEEIRFKYSNLKKVTH